MLGKTKDLLKEAIEDQKKITDLINEIHEIVERLKEKHPIYSAISSMERMREDLLMSHENYDNMIKKLKGMS